MSNNTKLVIAKFVAQPGKADALKKVLTNVLAPSRAEEGCIHYDLYRSIEDGNVFLFHETWKDQAALDHHNQQPHLQKVIVDTESLLKQPAEVNVF
ncbi:drug:proton antiporter [[Pantoea] beijingensis]|uniref:Drug:proton antiporter n=1 Tax=[Pantoea] beijingensis TaxID=1324864 RepID=A0A443IHV3_9GAMM|nr:MULTISPECIES: putative quinol monooxygenase [Erwiniaceae]RWR03678.1 drug:proton antiporter [[Pantoea] beijingensis]